MKIQFSFLLLLYLLQFSCITPRTSITTPEQEKQIVSKQPIQEVTAPQQSFPYKTTYNKHFKLISPQGYTRYIERIYYGPETEILKDFARIDTRKAITKENYIKFPIASFFSSSAISIPKERMQQAESIYKNFIDTLFLNSDYVSERHIEILVLGYTDESMIEEDSFLYNEILAQSQKESLTQTELYNLISYYRAKEIGTILSKLIHAKKEKFKRYHKFIVDIIQEGRGLEYPDAKREYEVEDSKRRIAKVYWNITDT